MEKAHDVLIRNLGEHTALEEDDVAQIRALTFTQRDVEPNEDFIRQGDEPEHSALVVSGMVARYHLLFSGGRQYLSFHLAGDLPDSQGLFIDQMDHGLCALGPASVAFIPHRELIAAFRRRPALWLAIWRETLLDAAIFREAITNNSARGKPARMAHLFCELFYRAKALGHVDGNLLQLPVSLIQLGEALVLHLQTRHLRPDLPLRALGGVISPKPTGEQADQQTDDRDDDFHRKQPMSAHGHRESTEFISESIDAPVP